jgi:hypothetical protein
MLSTSLRRILIASGFTIATSFMTALTASAQTAKTATLPAGFMATIAPSCSAGTPSLASPFYTPSPYIGSGGVLKLSASQIVAFNCNSSTVNVSAVVTLNTTLSGLTQNAAIATHKTKITNVNSPSNTATFNGSGTLTATSWGTDPANSGDISINVESEWTPQTGGQELLSGTYNATIEVTVTPN